MKNDKVSPEYRCENHLNHSLKRLHPEGGLTKRELFAGDILAAMIVAVPTSKKKKAVKWAVEYADALLKELAKEVENEG